MDTLQCAVVLAKLDRFDREITQRQAVARRYHALLAPEARGQTPTENAFSVLPWPRDDRTSVFAQYTILVQDRDALQARLHAAGIPTAVHYPVPLNAQPAYAHLCCPDCTPVAGAIACQVMSLPMHPDLTEHDQQRIAAALYAG
jgi:UDP-2-acetamido-2-deoxy-ribo-hexuluronate aminotransferase